MKQESRKETKSVKTDKVSEKNKNNKNKKNKAKKNEIPGKFNLTRAERRQIKTISALIDERLAINDRIDDLSEKLFCLRTSETPIDRDFAVIRRDLLNAYSNLLFMILHFENVRIRRKDGSFLHRNPEFLHNYLFGKDAYVEKRLKKTVEGSGKSVPADKKTLAKKTGSKFQKIKAAAVSASAKD